jgi:hypothetical protein
LLSPPPQKLDHNLTGSGTDTGISPIIGEESCSANIQTENTRPLHQQPSEFNGTNCNINPAVPAFRMELWKRTGPPEANALHILNKGSFMVRPLYHRTAGSGLFPELIWALTIWFWLPEVATVFKTV